MHIERSLLLALSLGFVGASAGAAQDAQHRAHHPAGAASSSMSKAAPGKSDADMARMDVQMKTMGAMHDRMMAAKTPEERSALMAEHMKAMQEGMTMMGGMGGMSSGGMRGMKGDMAAHHQMMEKRMEMMQATMQMMMDRLPPAPAPAN